MIEIKKLGGDDLSPLVELIQLYEDVFEMKEFILPSPTYLRSLLDRQGLTFLVAIEGKKVVGGLTAHDLPSTYFEANEVYVYDLAVAREYQRKGIGRRLLAELKTLCQRKGDSEFFLQADLEDTHAIEFYRSTGGIQESVFHFSFDTKGRLS